MENESKESSPSASPHSGSGDAAHEDLLEQVSSLREKSCALITPKNKVTLKIKICVKRPSLNVAAASPWKASKASYDVLDEPSFRCTVTVFGTTYNHLRGEVADDCTAVGLPVNDQDHIICFRYHDGDSYVHVVNDEGLRDCLEYAWSLRKEGNLALHAVVAGGTMEKKKSPKQITFQVPEIPTKDQEGSAKEVSPVMHRYADRFPHAALAITSASPPKIPKKVHVNLADIVKDGGMESRRSFSSEKSGTSKGAVPSVAKASAITGGARSTKGNTVTTLFRKIREDSPACFIPPPEVKKPNSSKKSGGDEKKVKKFGAVSMNYNDVDDIRNIYMGVFDESKLKPQRKGVRQAWVTDSRYDIDRLASPSAFKIASLPPETPQKSAKKPAPDKSHRKHANPYDTSAVYTSRDLDSGVPIASKKGRTYHAFENICMPKENTEQKENVENSVPLARTSNEKRQSQSPSPAGENDEDVSEVDKSMARAREKLIRSSSSQPRSRSPDPGDPSSDSPPSRNHAFVTFRSSKEDGDMMITEVRANPALRDAPDALEQMLEYLGPATAGRVENQSTVVDGMQDNGESMAELLDRVRFAPKTNVPSSKNNIARGIAEEHVRKAGSPWKVDQTRTITNMVVNKENELERVESTVTVLKKCNPKEIFEDPEATPNVVSSLRMKLLELNTAVQMAELLEPQQRKKALHRLKESLDSTSMSSTGPGVQTTCPPNTAPIRTSQDIKSPNKRAQRPPKPKTHPIAQELAKHSRNEQRRLLKNLTNTTKKAGDERRSNGPEGNHSHEWMKFWAPG